MTQEAHSYDTSRGGVPEEGSYIKLVWSQNAAPGSYFVVVNQKGAQNVVGKLQIPPGGYQGRVFVPVSTEGTFTIAGSAAEMNEDGSIGIFSSESGSSDLAYDQATQLMLGNLGASVSSVKRPTLQGSNLSFAL